MGTRAREVRTIAKSLDVTLKEAKGLRLRMRFFAVLGITGCARNDEDVRLLFSRPSCECG